MLSTYVDMFYGFPIPSVKGFLHRQVVLMQHWVPWRWCML